MVPADSGIQEYDIADLPANTAPQPIADKETRLSSIVDGRRYDTSALSGGGTRWTSAMRSTAGFVARHPPGL